MKKERTQKELQELYKKQRIQRGWSDGDALNIHDWFWNIVPSMIKKHSKFSNTYTAGFFFKCEKQYKRLHPGYNPKKDQQNLDKFVKKAWKDNLKRMIFFFNEQDEHTCSKKNKLSDRYHQVLNDYLDKYGLFGSKVNDNPYNKYDEEGKYISTTMNNEFAMQSLPEYKEIYQRFWNEQRKIDEYRSYCRRQALRRFMSYIGDIEG